MRTKFQSTSPYAGDDKRSHLLEAEQRIFQSTSPYAGDDLIIIITKVGQVIFQSTSPYAGDDIRPIESIYDCSDFNPHPPMRGMTQYAIHNTPRKKFQSTSPYAGDDIYKIYFRREP